MSWSDGGSRALKAWAVCCSMASLGLSSTALAQDCEYGANQSVGPEFAHDGETVSDRAARYVGRFTTRPNWFSKDFATPWPEELGTLLVEVRLAEGREHEWEMDLAPGSPASCPSSRLTIGLNIEVRNADGSFWAANERSTPSVSLTVGDSLGATTHQLKNELEVRQWPARWAAFGQRYEPDWDFVGFSMEPPVPVPESRGDVGMYASTPSIDVSIVLSNDLVGTLPFATVFQGAFHQFEAVP